MKEQKAKFRKYYNPDRKDLSHWLSGIIRCEKCGAVLSNQGGFFGCSNKSRGRCKGVGYIKTDKLDSFIFDTLSEIVLPNIKLEFAEKTSLAQNNSDSDEKTIKLKIQKLEERLDRIKSAYEEGIYTLEEYKKSKKSILTEIDNFKKISEKMHQDCFEDNKKTSPSEILRLTEILKNTNISNTKKNKVARTIFKEIIKGGDDGKTIKCIFWR